MITTTFTAHSHPETDQRIQVQPPAEDLALAPVSAGRITRPCDEKLRAEVRRLRDESGGEWTNKTIGRAIGRTDGAVSPYLSPVGNLYAGDTGELERRLRAWLRERHIIQLTRVPSIATEVSRAVASWLEEVRVTGGFGVFVAPPGLGKSRALDLYTDEHPLAIAMSAWAGERSRAAVEHLLFRAAKVSRERGRFVAANLVEKLKEARRLIIVDDAHYLTQEALALLCGFRERTGMPLALVGIPALEKRLAADPQRFRRITLYQTLDFGDLEAPRDLLSHHLDVLAPEAKGEDRSELRRLCAQMMGREGHFGAVAVCLANAGRMRLRNPDLAWPVALKHAHAALLRSYAVR